MNSLRSVWYCYVAACCIILYSCKPDVRPKDNETRARAEAARLDWSVTLDKKSTTPYGGAIAYSSLKYYFPNARIGDLSKWYQYTSIDDRMIYRDDDSASLLVLRGLAFRLQDKEWDHIRRFAAAGNEVMIFGSEYSDNITDALEFDIYKTGDEEQALSKYYDGTENRNLLTVSDQPEKYGYTGRYLAGYFTFKQTGSSTDTNSTMIIPDTSAYITDYPADTAIEEYEETEADGNDEYSNTKSYKGTLINIAPEILGYAGSNPNFVRYAVGDGHITLHAAPLALSNYFLLQKNNRHYLSAIWHSLPDDIAQIYWNDYGKRSTQGGGLQVLWRYPATRWGIIIALITLMLYVLFGMKKKQRVIPVIPPLENSSVSFVETIGQLYYNQGNHANLAEKMIQHFLETVRTRYYLDTNNLNEQFAAALEAKSGVSKDHIDELIRKIAEVRSNSSILTEEYLYRLYQLTREFTV